MRTAVVLSILCLLASCASTGAGPGVPEGAQETTRTESNGDVITEYRVANQLRVMKVTPTNGPAYYLYDNDGDGIVDKAGDNPPQTYFELFKW